MENQNSESRLFCPHAKMKLQASPLEQPRRFTIPSPTRPTSFNQSRLAGTALSRTPSTASPGYPLQLLEVPKFEQGSGMREAAKKTGVT